MAKVSRSLSLPRKVQVSIVIKVKTQVRKAMIELRT